MSYEFNQLNHKILINLIYYYFNIFILKNIYLFNYSDCLCPVKSIMSGITSSNHFFMITKYNNLTSKSKATSSEGFLSR